MSYMSGRAHPMRERFFPRHDTPRRHRKVQTKDTEPLIYFAHEAEPVTANLLREAIDEIQDEELSIIPSYTFEVVSIKPVALNNRARRILRIGDDPDNIRVAMRDYCQLRIGSRHPYRESEVMDGYVGETNELIEGSIGSVAIKKNMLIAYIQTDDRRLRLAQSNILEVLSWANIDAAPVVPARMVIGELPLDTGRAYKSAVKSIAEQALVDEPVWVDLLEPVMDDEMAHQATVAA